MDVVVSWKQLGSATQVWWRPMAYRGVHLAGSSVREENHCVVVGT